MKNPYQPLDQNVLTGSKVRLLRAFNSIAMLETNFIQNSPKGNSSN